MTRLIRARCMFRSHTHQADERIRDDRQRCSVQIRFRRVDWEYASVFRISYRTRTHSQTVLVEVEDDGLLGRGEALGVFYHGETIDVLLEQFASVARRFNGGVSRSDLQHLLPAGGVRNAL